MDGSCAASPTNTRCVPSTSLDVTAIPAVSTIASGPACGDGGTLLESIDPPVASNPDLPSAVDPRGLLTFGLSGLGTLAFAALLLRDARAPRALAWLGVLSAVLSLALYLGRLIVLDPASPLIALPAVAAGFVVNPAWYTWLGVVLMRRDALH